MGNISNLQLNFDNTNTTKTKICILTCENRKEPYIKFHDENVKEYCNKHGYTYIKYTDKPTDIPIYWWKIVAIDKLLQENIYDYVFWMDSDSIIVNLNFKLEQLVDMCNNKSLIIGHDAGDDMTYNAGIFLIKNNVVMKQFIKDCLKTLYNKECVSGTKIFGAWAGECYEQGTMNILLKNKYKDYFCVVGMHIICNYHLLPPNKNVFIYHNYVSRPEIRLSNFKYILENKK